MSNATASRTRRVSEKNYDNPASPNQIRLLVFFGYEDAADQGLTMKTAEAAIDEAIEQMPERYAEWKAIRAAEIAAEKSATPAPEIAPAESKTERESTGFLDRALAASAARYAAESREASRPQLRAVLNIAHRLERDSQERITLFGFLKGGMSGKAASRILTIAGQRPITHADLVGSEA